MSAWTAVDIPDLAGRTALVTGANSGLGFATSMALARHGACVIVACRDQARCAAAVARIKAAVPSALVEPARLDLADLASVHGLAESITASYERLDLLVNNAGVMAPPIRLTTKQGFELQFGTNHLGHFALTGLLLPVLLKAPGARVVTVSSFAHESGRIDFDDLQSERHYIPYGAYGESKLANILFMLELDRRLRLAGAKAISVGAHPGLSVTRLQATGPFMGANHVSAQLVLGGTRIVGQSAEEGAEPQLYAATAEDVSGGDYFGPRYLWRGHPVRARMSPQARDPEVASRLWEVSRELTGVDADVALPAATR